MAACSCGRTITTRDRNKPVADEVFSTIIQVGDCLIRHRSTTRIAARCVRRVMELQLRHAGLQKLHCRRDVDDDERRIITGRQAAYFKVIISSSPHQRRFDEKLWGG